MSTVTQPVGGERSLTSAMASRISRDSMLYTAVTVGTFPLALANTAVLVRFLSISDYGYLSIVLFWSGMLTIGLNLLVLRGIERHVWGASEDMMDLADANVTHGSLRGRALGTGIVLNVALAAIVGVAVALNASTLCTLLLLPRSFEPAVVWLGISGGLGSIWRLTTGILRWERRRTAFSIVYVMRWGVALAVSWALLIDGKGPPGVVAGVGMGSLASVLTALVLARKSYRPCLDRGAARAIAHKNTPMIAMIVGLTILHDADVFLLSRVAPASQVGLYRLATRMTSLISYAVSAFLIAWSPLEASSLFRATYAQLGRARVRTTFFTYYMIVGTLLVVLMSVTAAPVIAVVAPGYHESVGFVPLTSVAYLTYGMLVVLARASEFPHRYVIYGTATLGGAAVMIVTCLKLGGPLGGNGVALGDIVGALTGMSVVIAACLISHSRLAVEARRVGGTLLIGGLCFVIGVPFANAHPTLHPLLSACALALYPALLILTGIVPVGDRAMMRQIATDLNLRRRDRDRAMLVARVGDLPVSQQRVLLALLRDRQPAATVSQLLGITPAVLNTELVRGLRRISAAPGTGEHDEQIGEWLLSQDSVTSKDGVQRQIESDGATPAEIHAIEAAYTTLHSAPRKAWRATVLAGDNALPQPPWPLEPGVVELLGRAIRAGVPRQSLATEAGLSESDLDHQLVGGLRSLAGLPARTPFDRLIAAFVFDDRDAPPARQLWWAGIDPIEVHELELVLTAIRELPQPAWRRVERASDDRVPASLEHDASAEHPRQEPVPVPDAALGWLVKASGA